MNIIRRFGTNEKTFPVDCWNEIPYWDCPARSLVGPAQQIVCGHFKVVGQNDQHLETRPPLAALIILIGPIWYPQLLYDLHLRQLFPIAGFL